MDWSIQVQAQVEYFTKYSKLKYFQIEHFNKILKLDNTQVEHLVKYSTSVDQADKSLFWILKKKEKKKIIFGLDFLTLVVCCLQSFIIRNKNPCNI